MSNPPQPWFVEAAPQAIRQSPYTPGEHRYRCFGFSSELNLVAIITCNEVGDGEKALHALNEQYGAGLFIIMDRLTLDVVDATFHHVTREEKDEDA